MREIQQDPTEIVAAANTTIMTMVTMVTVTVAVPMYIATMMTTIMVMGTISVIMMRTEKDHRN